MQRREFIAATGAGTAAALAGCTGALGAVPAPAVPTSRLEEGGWVLREETQETVFEESYGPVTVTAKAHTLLYGDAALRRSLREKTLGRVDGRVAMFAATRIAFSPNLVDLPGGIATDPILDRTEAAARAQFESQMRAAGLTDVTRTDTGTLAIDTGETARLTEYEATYPVGDLTFDVTEEESIALPIGGIAVASDLAVWQHGGSVLVAGGAYPAETVDETVTTDLSSAISVTVDVHLGLDPASYRRELRGLITSVE
ncbi:MAG: hypothetical protein ABEJ77_01745 [Halanaeroarchaeum sp.]